MRWDTREDRRFREALEKRSVNEGRANPVEALNKLAGQDAVQRHANDVLMQLRASAQGRARTVGGMNARHDAHMAKAAAGATQDKTDPGPDPAFRSRFVSPLRAGKTPGAEGRVSGNARDRAAYEPGRDVRTIEPTEDVLTLEAMRWLAHSRMVSSRNF